MSEESTNEVFELRGQVDSLRMQVADMFALIATIQQQTQTKQVEDSPLDRKFPQQDADSLRLRPRPLLTLSEEGVSVDVENRWYPYGTVPTASMTFEELDELGEIYTTGQWYSVTKQNGAEWVCVGFWNEEDEIMVFAHFQECVTSGVV
jgi:hypothetical protein